MNNVRRVRTSSNSQRWADRIDEFSATQHNNTTNNYKQTAHSTEYKFKRRSERKLEAMEANLGCLCSCYGPEPTKQRVSSRYIHYVHWSRSIKSTQRLTVQNRRGEERQPKYLNCGASIHCNGKTNIIYERYKFNNRQQKADDRIDAYATVLRDLASSCNYGILNEEMIRDRIVCGITNSAVRKKLLQIPDLTYDKCMDVCRAAEATETQMSAMKTTESTYLSNDNINVVGTNSRKKPSGNESARTGGEGNPPLNVDIVAVITTGEEITAQPLANHVQNAVK